MLHQIKTLFLFLGLATAIIACDDPTEIGSDLSPTDGSIEIIYTDTVTIHTATVQMDSIATSGTSVLLVGRYSDDRLGSTTAKSFWSPHLEESPSLTENEVYDSLVLWLDHTYYYGDTLQTQQINVHRLTEELSESETYYAAAKVGYEAEPIGSYTFSPRPSTRRPLQIRLSDQLGRALFAQIQAGSFTDEDFTEYVKGLALVPGTDDNGAVLGFNAISDSTALRLYYHTGDLQAEQKYISFTETDASARFNQFTSERNNENLPSLQSRQAVTSDSTGQAVFLQAGTGLMARIDIPYLRSFQALGTVKVTKAELLIQPVQGSFGKTAPLPQTLTLYEASGGNQILTTSTSEILATAVLTEDVVNSDKLYKVDLTDYILSLFEASSNSKTGILVSFNSTTYQNTVERLILGGTGNTTDPIQLKLYYTLLRQEY